MSKLAVFSFLLFYLEIIVWNSILSRFYFSLINYSPCSLRFGALKVYRATPNHTTAPPHHHASYTPCLSIRISLISSSFFWFFSFRSICLPGITEVQHSSFYTAVVILMTKLPRFPSSGLSKLFTVFTRLARKTQFLISCLLLLILGHGELQPRVISPQMPMEISKLITRAGDWSMKKAVKHGGISNLMWITKSGRNQ